MRGKVCLILAAAVIGAAAVLTGCSHDPAKRLDSTDTSALPASTVTQAPVGALLPSPQALTDVLNRLADPAIPGNDKLSLVEGSTPDTAAALDRFTTAARDGGYLPMGFRADHIAWSSTNSANVTATVVVTTANPDHREFTFPMEFNSFQGGWQLSRKTAETLLAMQNARSWTPPSTPPEQSSPAPPTPSPTP